MRPATVHVAGDRIEKIGEWNDFWSDSELVDVDANVVMPGIVDTHVHVNEPGRTDWEGFETATRAAAAGGITTLLDMPLNSIPPTTTVEALEAKRAAARGKTVVNVEFIGGIVPGNANELARLAEAGVRAFKCFLSPSGVDEFPNVTERDLAEALPILARLDLPLMVHAEDPARLVDGIESYRYRDYLATRPAVAERSAIELLVRLMERSPSARVHIVHLSSASSLDVVRAARRRGLPLTVETCPHYLTFAAEEIPDGATEYKCAPPIRERAEREGLWQALLSGDIQMIASDHSPCPPKLKQTGGDFFSAWGGISSLQLSLSAVWTGAKERGATPAHVSKWMSTATAKLASLGNRKGAIARGYDADVVVFDPDASFIVEPAKLDHKHKLTPYSARALHGVVQATFVRGNRVFPH